MGCTSSIIALQKMSTQCVFGGKEMQVVLAIGLFLDNMLFLRNRHRVVSRRDSFLFN